MFSGSANNAPVNIDDVKDIVRRLKCAGIYLLLFILFWIAFSRIVCYYMNESKKYDQPVDARAWDCKCVDPDYVKGIKENHIYKIPQYQHSFLLMDAVFPIIYTLMFLSLVRVRNNTLLYTNNFKGFHDIAVWLAVAGMAFDYLENISFFTYLHTGFQLAMAIAVISAIKTILFALNLCIFAFALTRSIVILKQNR